jgi:uncharacterized protein (DUF885 family)
MYFSGCPRFVMLVGVALLTSIVSAQKRDGAAPAVPLNTLADDFVREFTAAHPLGAVFLGMPDAPNDRLDDNSLAATKAWEVKEDRWLERLKHIDVADLPSADQATHGVLLETLEGAVQGRVCRSELWPLNQQSGLQIYLAILSQLQPLGTDQLRTEALARWHAMPRYIDTEIDNLREGLRRGYTLPRNNVQAVIDQLDDLLRASPGESPLAALGDRDHTAGFQNAVRDIVGREIMPALTRYRAFLRADYLARARTTTAIAAIPNGEACYRASVRRYASVDMDPNAVHQLGLDQTALIEAQMRAIGFRVVGTADVPTILERLRTDPKYKFQTREEIIRVTEEAVQRALAAMPRILRRLPKTRFIVEPCQPFEEKAACPGSYVAGTPDGKRPGRFRLNAGDPTSQLRTAAEGTAFHEGIPGHHLQISRAQEREGAHPITRYFGFSGFSEGWALYAERVADEMGLYSSDVDRLGDLNEQALRAARLVVDPGLHVLGWSRQQAIDYMTAHLAYPQTYIVSEVDRYIADPGQATAYMIGRLEIERLRDKATKGRGSRFDLRDFHERILENGSVPLYFLRAHIERWLAENASIGP